MRTLIDRYLDGLRLQHRYAAHSLLAIERDLQALIRLLGPQVLHAGQSDGELQGIESAVQSPLADSSAAEPLEAGEGQSAAGVAVQMSADHIRSALARARVAGASPATLARMASSWRGFSRWLIAGGFLVRDPMQGIRTPKKPRRLPKALSPDEALALLAGPQSCTDVSNAPHASMQAPSGGAGHIADAPAVAMAPTDSMPADAATASIVNRSLVLAELLYGSGLRISEALGLDRSEADWRARSRVRAGLLGGWINWSAGEIYVTGKGAKPRVVPLTAFAAERLRCLLSEPVDWSMAGTERPVFVNARGRRLSVRSAQQGLAAWAGSSAVGRHVHPHMLRHSFASHVLQSSGDMRAVQELMGHASIASTQVYTALDFQHLSAVYDKAHPRARRRTS